MTWNGRVLVGAVVASAVVAAVVGLAVAGSPGAVDDTEVLGSSVTRTGETVSPAPPTTRVTTTTTVDIPAEDEPAVTVDQPAEQPPTAAASSDPAPAMPPVTTTPPATTAPPPTATSPVQPAGEPEAGPVAVIVQMGGDPEMTVSVALVNPGTGETVDQAFGAPGEYTLTAPTPGTWALVTEWTSPAETTEDGVTLGGGSVATQTFIDVTGPEPKRVACDAATGCSSEP